MIIIKTRGTDIKKIFLIKSLSTKPRELSDMTITIRPNRNTKSLYLKYPIFSLEIKKLIDAIKINKGK